MFCDEDIFWLHISMYALVIKIEPKQIIKEQLSYVGSIKHMNNEQK